MSDSSSRPLSPASPSPQPERELVQSVRRELIESQLVVLELNDQILQKQTDKADAIALLCQAELVLEQKISHIMELDRVLNLQIDELKSHQDELKSRHATLNLQLGEAQNAQQQSNAIIEDLTKRLDAANREIGQTHEMARKINTALAASEATRNQLGKQQSQHTDKIAADAEQLKKQAHEINKLTELLATTKSELDRSNASHQATQQELTELQQSRSWRWTRFFRS